MQYRTLPGTEMKVSEVCLGTMTWGEQNSEAEAHEQLDYALTQGINFIDTAEMYPVPPNAQTQGRTEKYLGTWLTRQQRNRLYIATKIAGPGRRDWIRGGRTDLTKDVIAATSDWSLDRAARTMNAGHIRHLMVVEGDHKVVGILSMSEIVAAWVREPEAVSEINAETGELPALGAAHAYLYGLRRTAKQHLVAAKCPCQWEWVQVLEGQLEDRPDLEEETLAHLWDVREPCPALHAEGGGAD